jgi:hypothetical protein
MRFTESREQTALSPRPEGGPGEKMSSWKQFSAPRRPRRWLGALAQKTEGLHVIGHTLWLKIGHIPAKLNGTAVEPGKRFTSGTSKWRVS